MNRCGKMREQIADVALGAASSEPLTLHLAECAACSAELERQRLLVQRVDLAVETLVRAEPPSRLLEGIITRAQGTRAPRPWFGGWRGVAVSVAFAAVIAGLSLGLRASGWMSRQDAAAVMAWRSPTAALLEPLGNVVVAPLDDSWSHFKLTPSRQPHVRRDS